MTKIQKYKKLQHERLQLDRVNLIIDRIGERADVMEKKAKIKAKIEELQAS